MRISDWSSDVCSSDLHPCASVWLFGRLEYLTSESWMQLSDVYVVGRLVMLHVYHHAPHSLAYLFCHQRYAEGNALSNALHQVCTSVQSVASIRRPIWF